MLVARVGERRDAYGVLMGKNLKERDHLEEEGVDGTRVLKWVLKELDDGEWLRMRTCDGLF